MSNFLDWLARAWPYALLEVGLIIGGVQFVVSRERTRKAKLRVAEATLALLEYDLAMAEKARKDAT